jgi:hypothetical protein
MDVGVRPDDDGVRGVRGVRGEEVMDDGGGCPMLDVVMEGR